MYRGDRYSEDLGLDAHVGACELADIGGLPRQWGRVVTGLKDFGVQAEIQNERESKVGHGLDVSYRGPLHDGRDRAKGKARVDIIRRPEKVGSGRELETSEYDEAVDRARADWERDWRPLLRQFVAYEDVRRGLALLPL